MNFRRINKWLAQGLDLGEGYSVLLFYKSIDVYCCMTSAWAIVKENIVIHMNGVFFNFSGVNSYSFVNRCPFLPSFLHSLSIVHSLFLNEYYHDFLLQGSTEKRREETSLSRTMIYSCIAASVKTPRKTKIIAQSFKVSCRVSIKIQSHIDRPIVMQPLSLDAHDHAASWRWC